MTSRSIWAVVLLVCCSFGSNELENLLSSLQTNLQIPPETNAAKTKLEVTAKGFVRFTKTFKSGKQNYASLNLDKFLKLDYWGTSQTGVLILRSVKNDVIIQTFHDPVGDVDSMSTHLDIPLAAMEPEQLNTIEYQLRRIKVLLLQKQ